MKEDLARPCDSCGKPIGGAYYKCPRCKIYFCFFCGTQLMLNIKDNYPTKCPMCGEKLQ
jgi:DNA-directed RNA polymerase subunit RPC12/RpoP